MEIKITVFMQQVIELIQVYNWKSSSHSRDAGAFIDCIMFLLDKENINDWKKSRRFNANAYMIMRGRSLAPWAILSISAYDDRASPHRTF